jgi:hypothetical protein
MCMALAAETNDERSDALVVDVRLALSPAHREELQHLFKNGPVHDGDVISKMSRDDLVRWRLATRINVRGQWGYTAATYLGGHVIGDRAEVTS